MTVDKRIAILTNKLQGQVKAIPFPTATIENQTVTTEHIKKQIVPALTIVTHEFIIWIEKFSY